VRRWGEVTVLTILIVDDHAIMRGGMREVLCERFPGVEVVEAENGSVLVTLAAARRWDLCILDINMPGPSGLDLVETLLRIQPAIPILVFSMYPEARYGVRMMRLGAKGYVNKASAPDQLMKAVEVVLAGRRYINPELAECLANASRSSASLLHESLSKREFDVLRRLVQGKPAKEIARDLGVSPSTVGTYRRRILYKLGVNSNAELCRYAIEHSVNE
jgi:DNA-binding NarL/FixJ family response regulator